MPTAPTQPTMPMAQAPQMPAPAFQQPVQTPTMQPQMQPGFPPTGQQFQQQPVVTSGLPAGAANPFMPGAPRAN